MWEVHKILFGILGVLALVFLVGILVTAMFELVSRWIERME